MQIWIHSAEPPEEHRYEISNQPILKGQTSVPDLCKYGYIPLSHLRNIAMRSRTTTTANFHTSAAVLVTFSSPDRQFCCNPRGSAIFVHQLRCNFSLLAGDQWWPRTSGGRLRFAHAITHLLRHRFSHFVNSNKRNSHKKD